MRWPFAVLMYGLVALLCRQAYMVTQPTKYDQQLSLDMTAVVAEVNNDESTLLQIRGADYVLRRRVATSISAMATASYVPTVAPTGTSVPTATVASTPTLPPDVVHWSRYDPEEGLFDPSVATVNCSQWDIASQKCLSTLRHGEDFHEWYWKAAACAPDKYLWHFVVVSPSWMVGDWWCLDTGGDPRIQAGEYVDFLIRHGQVPVNPEPWGMLVYGYWRR